MAEINNNPLILSLETSGSTCGVALSRGTELVSEYTVYGINLHDRLMAEFIRRLLADVSMEVSNLDAVAVSAGPGSFTGLRIGASIAKALCFDDKPRLISVPTLEAIAYAAKEFALAVNSKEIVAVVPSHKDLVYYQSFDLELKPASEVFFIEKEEFNNLDKPGIVFCGPAADQIRNGFRLSGLNRITPRFIARLAHKYYMEDRFTAPEDFVPLYVQDFQPKTIGKK